jgi:hypothetical protein
VVDLFVAAYFPLLLFPCHPICKHLFWVNSTFDLFVHSVFFSVSSIINIITIIIMPPSSASFSLQVMLGYGVDSRTEAKLNKTFPSASNNTFAEMENFISWTYTSLTKNNVSSATASTGEAIITVSQDSFFVVSASNVHLTMDPPEYLWKTTTHQMLVFVPPQMISTCLEKYFTSKNTSGSSFWVKPPASAKFANDLLPEIHPSLLGCTIRGIIMTNLAENGPADILLVEVPKGVSTQDIVKRTNDVSIAASTSCILKMLPVTTVKFVDDDTDHAHSPTDVSSTTSKSGHSTLRAAPTARPLLPTCPVCLHRVDPVRLGLPAPNNEQLCSRFCPSPICSSWVNGGMMVDDVCPKQKFLHSWPLPARCKACKVIRDYWDFHKSAKETGDEVGDLFCEDCSMHKTLWTWYVRKCSNNDNYHQRDVVYYG